MPRLFWLDKDLTRWEGVDHRAVPMYPVTEAAEILGMHPGTLRSWVRGGRPLTRLPDEETGLLAFNNLVETHLILATRVDHKVTRRALWPAVEMMQSLYGGEYPLLDLRFVTEGQQFFLEALAGRVSLTKGEQHAITERMERYLSRLVRDGEGKPAAFFPVFATDWFVEQKVIQIRPGYGSCRPCVVGTSIPVDMLRRRAEGGDTVEELASDYHLPEETVRAVLRLVGAPLAGAR